MMDLVLVRSYILGASRIHRHVLVKAAFRALMCCGTSHNAWHFKTHMIKNQGENAIT